MKTIQELNESKIPIVRINNSLKKYKTMPIFQEKVDKANEMLRTTGLPKPATKTRHASNKTHRSRSASHA
ncbi:MAG TPA: hypothetical protein VFI29_01010 [Hanamia sp.]|nr:hypothetical protein [Hanamia sp.]